MPSTQQHTSDFPIISRHTIDLVVDICFPGLHILTFIPTSPTVPVNSTVTVSLHVTLYSSNNTFISAHVENTVTKT